MDTLSLKSKNTFHSFENWDFFPHILFTKKLNKKYLLEK
jgi:hypothetical protein